MVNRFGAQVVHQGVDMQVYEGEVFGIIGGSGSGKSVLLRTILGLRKPNAGSVRFLGRELGSMSAAELRALKASYGVTFQQGALFSSLNVPPERATADARAPAAAGARTRRAGAAQDAAGRAAGGARRASIRRSSRAA